jgi:hypothetical protein
VRFLLACSSRPVSSPANFVKISVNVKRKMRKTRNLETTSERADHDSGISPAAYLSGPAPSPGLVWIGLDWIGLDRIGYDRPSKGKARPLETPRRWLGSSLEKGRVYRSVWLG